MNEMAALGKAYTNRPARTQVRDGGRALPGAPQGSNVMYSTDVGTSACNHSIGPAIARDGQLQAAAHEELVGCTHKIHGNRKSVMGANW